MKCLRLTLLLAVLLPVLVSAHGAATDPVIPPRIVATAARMVDDGVAPALVVAMVDDGRVAVAGYGKLADGRAPDAHTVFEIGSVTKTFTALLLAQEVQQGKVTLDTPVASWLSGWRLPSRNGKAITLGALAEQYSGLPRVSPDLASASMADPYADYDAGRLKAFLAGYNLPRDPGAAYEYSNIGFGLLGYALATHARLGYGELLRQRVLQPLGMDSTAAELTHDLSARLAPGHDITGRPASHWRWRDAMAGAGAVLSDGHDMLTYLQVNMGTAPTPLAAAMKLAQQPRLGAGASGRIGLAWMTTSTPDGDVTWKDGATGGYSSFIGFTADHRHGVVLMANSLEASGILADLGMAALSPKSALPEVSKAVSLPPATLDDYAGQYELRPGLLITVFRNGDRLDARATGQGAFPLNASARDAFFANVAGIRIDFQRDRQGKVVALVLRQGGVDRRAVRLAVAVSEQGAHAVNLAPEVLQGYVGHYAVASDAIFNIVERNGQLYAQLTGQPALPIYASAKDRFFYTAADAMLEFQRDAGGRVVALVLHQGGQSTLAPREP